MPPKLLDPRVPNYPQDQQFPSSNWIASQTNLVQKWLRDQGWRPPVQGGLLDRNPDIDPNAKARAAKSGLLVPVGDVVDARDRFRGLLHTPDLMQQQQMQQGEIPHMGGGGVAPFTGVTINPAPVVRPQGGFPPPVTPGKFGSKWRDPAAVEQYATQQGIPPGLLAPVGRPPAQVTEHPTTKSNRLFEEGMKMSDARQAAMTVKSVNDLAQGDRIQLHPATDRWMRGDRYGEVRGFNKEKGYFWVKMDTSGQRIKVKPDDLLRMLSPNWKPGD